jgi:hypothetical protein
MPVDWSNRHLTGDCWVPRVGAAGVAGVNVRRTDDQLVADRVTVVHDEAHARALHDPQL